MDEVGAFDAKTHLPKLFDRVERGGRSGDDARRLTGPRGACHLVV